MEKRRKSHTENLKKIKETAEKENKNASLEYAILFVLSRGFHPSLLVPSFSCVGFLLFPARAVYGLHVISLLVYAIKGRERRKIGMSAAT